MGIFFLKFRDTRPALEVTLKNPDGTVHDLTGATDITLHILLNTGAVLSRDMQVVGAATAGTVMYVWLATDWDSPGGLITSPQLPDLPANPDHLMEYEVIGSTGERTTFPNDTYDILRITADIGDTP